MAFTVEKLMGEPVIVAQFESQVNAREIIDAYLKILEVSLMTPGPVSYVIDIARVSTPPIRIISSFKDLIRAVSSAAVDPNMIFAFVAQPELQSDMSDQNITFFNTLPEARAFFNAKQQLPLTA